MRLRRPRRTLCISNGHVLRPVAASADRAGVLLEVLPPRCRPRCVRRRAGPRGAAGQCANDAPWYRIRAHGFRGNRTGARADDTGMCSGNAQEPRLRGGETLQSSVRWGQDPCACIVAGIYSGARRLTISTPANRAIAGSVRSPVPIYGRWPPLSARPVRRTVVKHFSACYGEQP